MKVRFLKEFYGDLSSIRRFIAGGQPRYAPALRLAKDITEFAAGLTVFPHRHEAVPLLAGDARVIRRVPVQRRYLIIYRVDDARAEVVILGVFATRRDPAGLAEILGRG